ncbi:MAG: SusD/RagB family nutrient-binding outer membrane lipoprotein [Chlorobi bacterium]|nr:SusD/RagB family nutrient-binding outer membrane lipoprotein [Chlorobiota bacterium]
MRKIYLFFLILLGFSISCTKNFEEYNTDKKSPTVVDGEFLVSNAQKELVDQISSTNVNLNIWKLVSQYWTETTYTDEANYDIVNRTIPDNIFSVYYRQVLKPLDEAKKIISDKETDQFVFTEASKTNELMIIKLIEVYCYHNLVNMFGDVPYTDAINIDIISPKYDDAATIYADLLTQIDNAVAAFTVGAPNYIGSADLFYGGDVSAWIKFAQSLKLKIAINLADVNPTVAQTNVEAAVAAGVFTSAADNALMQYEGSSPNTNTLYEDLVLSGRSDFVAANTIVDLMDGLNDPRMDYYFTYKIDTSGNGDMAYLGGNYGYSSAYPSYSHINDAIQAPDFPGILMTYSEIQFYIAEAAERGWSVGQTAQAAYEEAITASFAFWGAPLGTYLTDAGVDYTAAADQAARMDLIGTQAYISFYTRGFVAYTEYRRFDVPQMNVAPSAATGGPVPTRFTYPVNEQTLNADNYASAATAVGGDDMLTLLFWDVAAPSK